MNLPGSAHRRVRAPVHSIPDWRGGHAAASSFRAP